MAFTPEAEQDVLLLPNLKALAGSFLSLTLPDLSTPPPAPPTPTPPSLSHDDVISSVYLCSWARLGWAPPDHKSLFSLSPRHPAIA